MGVDNKNFLTLSSAKTALGHVFGLSATTAPLALEVGLLDAGGVEVSMYGVPATTYARVLTAPADWAFTVPITGDPQIGIHNIQPLQFPAVGSGETWRVNMIGIFEAGTDNLLAAISLDEEVAYGTGSTPIIPQYGASLFSDFTKL